MVFDQFIGKYVEQQGDLTLIGLVKFCTNLLMCSIEQLSEENHLYSILEMYKGFANHLSSCEQTDFQQIESIIKTYFKKIPLREIYPYSFEWNYFGYVEETIQVLKSKNVLNGFIDLWCDGNIEESKDQSIDKGNQLKSIIELVVKNADEDTPLCEAQNISDGFLGFLKNNNTSIQNIERTLSSLLPIDNCHNCNENHWEYVSFSPNYKASTWTCKYCNKKMILKVNGQEIKNQTLSRQAIPKDVQRQVWRRDSGQCVDCGSKRKLEYDHIIPVSKGGANTVRNIQLLCEKCNRQKSNSI